MCESGVGRRLLSQRHAKEHLFCEYVFALQSRSRNNLHLEHTKLMEFGKSFPTLSMPKSSAVFPNPEKHTRELHYTLADGAKECSARKVPFPQRDVGNLPEAKRQAGRG